MGIFSRATPAQSSGEAANPQRVSAARQAQSDFARTAGDPAAWTDDQRATFNAVVSERQHAEHNIHG